MIKAVRWGKWLVQNTPQLVRAVPQDPLGTWLWVREELVDRRERQRPPCPYQPDSDWEIQLHAMLGAPWPCELTSEYSALWPQVMQPFQQKKVKIGRGEFAGWGDGEPGMIRAVWCLLRHLRPEKVIETGVARGFTSRFILEAFERNSTGHLWSIDLPPVQAPELHAQVGAAVPPHLRHRWSYVRGTSRQRLQKLLERLGEIGLFVHDSRHTQENVRFELDRAWGALQPGNAVVADDIDTNWGFHSFTQKISGYQALTCYAEPLRPDITRFEAKGLFGIVRKTKMIEGHATANQRAASEYSPQ